MGSLSLARARERGHTAESTSIACLHHRLADATCLLGHFIGQGGEREREGGRGVIIRRSYYLRYQNIENRIHVVTI